MKPRKFTAKAENGRLPDHVAKQIGVAIKDLSGRFVQVTVSEYVPNRSNAQNAFYYGVIIPAIREHLAQFGAVLSPEDVHDFTVKSVWKHCEMVQLPDGEFYEKRLSSTNLSKPEWENMLTITRAYWAERGLMLPHPNEHIYGGIYE